MGNAPGLLASRRVDPISLTMHTFWFFTAMRGYGRDEPPIRQWSPEQVFQHVFPGTSLQATSQQSQPVSRQCRTIGSTSWILPSIPRGMRNQDAVISGNRYRCKLLCLKQMPGTGACTARDCHFNFYCPNPGRSKLAKGNATQLHGAITTSKRWWSFPFVFLHSSKFSYPGAKDVNFGTKLASGRLAQASVLSALD